MVRSAERVSNHEEAVLRDLSMRGVSKHRMLIDAKK